MLYAFLQHLFRQPLVQVWMVCCYVSENMLSGSKCLFVFIAVSDTLNAKLIEKSIITFLRLKVPAYISTVAHTLTTDSLLSAFPQSLHEGRCSEIPLLLRSILPDLGWGEWGGGTTCVKFRGLAFPSPL